MKAGAITRLGQDLGNVVGTANQINVAYQSGVVTFSFSNGTTGSGAVVLATSPTITTPTILDLLSLNSNINYSPQVVLTGASATANSAPYVIVNRTRGTWQAPTAVNNGDALGTFLVQGNGLYAADVTVTANGAPSTNVPAQILITLGTAAGSRTALGLYGSGLVTVGGVTTPLTSLSAAWAYFQFGGNSSVMGDVGTAAGGSTHLSENAHYDGTNWKYISTDLAANYYQNLGVHAWRVAASGTAGNNITWSEILSGTIAGIIIQGTNTNNNAAVGKVGEYVSSQVVSGSAVALTTNTVANVTSISLTAGDWDVTGVIDFLFAATTSYTNLAGGVSTTSATLGAQDQAFDFEIDATVPTATKDPAFVVPTVRLSLNATTTVYLVALATFTVSTLKAYGTIRARRMR